MRDRTRTTRARTAGTPAAAPARPGGRPGHGGDRTVRCPDCGAPIAIGGSRRCPPCEALHQDYIRVRDYLYRHQGSGQLTAMAEGTGVPIDSISRLMLLGYLHRGSPGGRTGRSGRAGDFCDVCHAATNGTTLCDACRGRFTDTWQTWLDDRYGPPLGAGGVPATAAAEPEEWPEPAEAPEPADGDLPLPSGSRMHHHRRGDGSGR